MSDLIERLREPMVKGLHHPDDDLRKEAAAEIARLRAALAAAQAEPCPGCGYSEKEQPEPEQAAAQAGAPGYEDGFDAARNAILVEMIRCREFQSNDRCCDNCHCVGFSDAMAFVRALRPSEPAGAPSEEEISRALEDYVPGAADHQGAVAAMMALLRRGKE